MHRVKHCETLASTCIDRAMRRALLCTNPPFEKPVGDLAGACSRRINIQPRLVYQVIPERRTVKVLRMWGDHE